MLFSESAMSIVVVYRINVFKIFLCGSKADFCIFLYHPSLWGISVAPLYETHTADQVELTPLLNPPHRSSPSPLPFANWYQPVRKSGRNFLVTFFNQQLATQVGNQFLANVSKLQVFVIRKKSAYRIEIEQKISDQTGIYTRALFTDLI
jgi:hypothetical protein